MPPGEGNRPAGAPDDDEGDVSQITANGYHLYVNDKKVV